MQYEITFAVLCPRDYLLRSSSAMLASLKQTPPNQYAVKGILALKHWQTSSLCNSSLEQTQANRFNVQCSLDKTLTNQFTLQCSLDKQWKPVHCAMQLGAKTNQFTVQHCAMQLGANTDKPVHCAMQLGATPTNLWESTQDRVRGLSEADSWRKCIRQHCAVWKSTKECVCFFRCWSLA